jgi:allantoate deiminase
MERLDRLADFTEEPGKLTRHYLTPAHGKAAMQVRDWMEQASMTARIDAAGNVVGRYEGQTGNAPALILGSHIDTVSDAGKYDGNLGVVAAIACVEALDAAGIRLSCAVEIAAFGDEEGVRFPVAMTGSRAFAGALAPGVLESRDATGMSLRQALREFGCDPDALPASARRRDGALGYAELHIEQGPVLEAEGLPVGIVTAINGASRYAVNVAGRAGHAGTVPMGLRRDALAAAAEMTLAVEAMATRTTDLLATVGALSVAPGVTNVIPGSARFTIDMRSPDDAVRNRAEPALEETLRAIAARRDVGMDFGKTHEAPAIACSPDMMDMFEASVAKAGIRPYRLPSGAGHDGQALAALCPVAMLFVRCRGGISHNPAELIARDDADIAVRVLYDFILSFARAG